MKYPSVIFDLDGTLLDTLTAIASAANHACEALDLPPRPHRDWLPLVGYGLEHLLRHALGPRRSGDLPEAVAAFRQHYDQHGDGQIQPYPGISELLGELQDAGVSLSVLSNKPHVPTQANIANFFPDIRFACVLGQREGVPVKPDATAALEIAAQTDTAAQQCAFVGDSDVDMHTARAAGMLAVGVTWGFRTEAVLRECGADVIVHEPGEVGSVVLGVQSQRR